MVKDLKQMQISYCFRPIRLENYFRIEHKRPSYRELLLIFGDVNLLALMLPPWRHCWSLLSLKINANRQLFHTLETTFEGGIS